MGRSRALVFRPGPALGDACFITAMPRVVAEKGYIVDLACTEVPRPLYENNPYVSGIVDLPIHWQDIKKKKEWIKETVERYDKVFHASGHVEVGLLYRTDAAWGCPLGPDRRKAARGKSYQDEIFKGAGLKVKGVLPEFYFTKEEEQAMKKLRRQLDKDRKKLVLWQFEGSSQSKTLVWAPEYLKWTMEKFPNTAHYVFTNKKNLKAQLPNDNRIFDAMEKTNIRQSVMLTKIADLVIGPESFLINAAAAFDTPKVLFLSHSSPMNLAKYFKNCWCITPTEKAPCHPCYLIQVDFQGVFNPEKRGIAREFQLNCQVWNRDFIYESLGVKCCFHLPHEKVQESIAAALSRS